MFNIFKTIIIKIYKLINIFLFMPFFLIILFVNLFAKVRFYPIDYLLGGSSEIQLYLYNKKQNLYNKYIDFFFIEKGFEIFFLKEKISNAFWLKIISKDVMFIRPSASPFFLIYNYIIKNIYDIIVFFKVERLKLKAQSYVGVLPYSKENLKVYEKVKNPVIKLTKKDISECINEYEELNKLMKIKPNQSIITFCNRDSAYKKMQIKNWDSSYHAYRNFPINDYKLCVSEMIEKNFFLIRMGNITEKKLELSNENFFDYSKSNKTSPLMDVYLIYKSKFFVGPQSGLDKISSFFHKPTVFINETHLKWRPTHMKNSFFICKKFLNLKNNKFLTFKEMLDPNLKRSKINNNPLGLYLLQEDYTAAGIKVINNTPEEIYKVVEEMNLDLDGNLELSNEDLQLQKEFWSKFDDEFPFSSMHKISPFFLRNNQDLLE